MKDIVVTGMGVLSTAGFSLSEFWETLKHGKNTYGPIEALAENPQYRIKIGASIKSQQWKQNIDPSLDFKYGKSALYAASTAKKALLDAQIQVSDLPAGRVAVVIGTTMGEVQVEESITERLHHGKNPPLSDYQKYATCNIVRAISEVTGVRGHLYTVPAACAAGNYAVSIAKKLLDWNVVDIAIAGGVDVFSKVAFAGFQRLLSLTPDVCRPFDKNRKGLVIGEGCGIIIMERENGRTHQKVYGRILGTGLASNAYHMTAPHINGTGELAAMQNALHDANIDSSNIDYISAHGTGTKKNDYTEAKAILRLFGATPPPVSSIKSMLGHSMGAASILELIASFLMLKHDTLLPTMNFEAKDEACDLDIVANAAKKKKIQSILSNSFAFGGQTSSIVIGA